MTRTLKTLCAASAAALLAACGGGVENTTTAADYDDDAPVTVAQADISNEFAPLVRDGITLEQLMMAELTDASGEDIGHVDDALIQDGRVVGLIFENEDLLGDGSETMMRWDSARFRMVDGDDDLQILLPRGSELSRSVMAFDDDNLPMGAMLAQDLIDETVTYQGEEYDIEGATLARNGTIQTYLLDGGLLDAPDSVPASAITLTEETREEVLGAVEVADTAGLYAADGDDTDDDDDYEDVYDYSLERK